MRQVPRPLMSKFGLYARISTTGQEEGTSLITQEKSCRAFLSVRGDDVDEGYVEREIFSGADLYDRAGLNRLRDAVRRGEIRGIVCHAVDRLSRDPVHLLILVEEFEKHEAQLLFATETLDDSALGKLVLHVHGYAAQVEREKIKERSLRGKRALLDSGKIHRHGLELYGYVRDKERGVRIIKEDEATVVRMIYTWIGAERASCREVTRRLNHQEIPTPLHAQRLAHGKPAPRWESSQVRMLVRNPAYKGETIALHYGKRGKDRNKNRNAFRRPAEEWVHLPAGVTPPIVSAELWQAAQEQIERNHAGWRRTGMLPCLLRGHISCARCGCRMSPNRLVSGHLYYQCNSRFTSAGRCGARMARADKIDHWAWEQVVTLLTSGALFAETQKAHAKASTRTDGDAERKQIERAIHRIEGQQARLLQRFGASDDPDFPWELVERQVAALQKERVVQQSRLDALHPVAPAVDTASVLRLPHEELRALATQNLQGFSFEQKRRTLAALDVRVLADGAEWSFG